MTPDGPPEALPIRKVGRPVGGWWEVEDPTQAHAMEGLGALFTKTVARFPDKATMDEWFEAYTEHGKLRAYAERQAYGNVTGALDALDADDLAEVRRILHVIMEEGQVAIAASEKEEN